MRRGLLLVVAACAPPGAVHPVPPPAAGIAIALYAGASSFGVVDDRRWVEVTSGTLVLGHIDPGAALASLVIEPLSDSLQVGACTRDRIPDTSVTRIRPAPGRHVVEPVEPAPPPPPDRYTPDVRCAVTAAPGRHLVRLLYVSTTLAYHAQHEVALVAADRAAVTSRFAIATPAWDDHAEVALYDGMPGGDHPPRELAHGRIALDGSTAVLDATAPGVPAELRRVFDAAPLVAGVAPTDAAWRHDATGEVWVWLELPGAHLAPGPVRVHVELPGEPIRDAVVADEARQQADRAGAPLRLPLWIDDALHGTRQRFGDFAADATLAERFMLAVANVGDVPRTVWIEEHLRPVPHHRVERAWPAKPLAEPDLLRSKLEVRPGKVERVGYTVAYDF